MQLHPARLPRFPSRSLEFLFSLKELRCCSFRTESRAGLILRGLCCALSPSAEEFEDFFFFIIHSLASPFRPAPAPSSLFTPSCSNARKRLLTPSSLCRFPDQVQLLPASPSPPSSRNRRSKSGFQRRPSATLPDQLREDLIPSETQASGETGFPFCFSFAVFL